MEYIENVTICHDFCHVCLASACLNTLCRIVLLSTDSDALETFQKIVLHCVPKEN